MIIFRIDLGHKYGLGHYSRIKSLINYLNLKKYKIVIDNQLFNEVQAHNTNSIYLYNKLIDANVAPEQARSVLPLNTYTNWIWSGTLYAFARVCKLRLDDHAQKETRDIARALDVCCKDAFPISWKYLMKDET